MEKLKLLFELFFTFAKVGAFTFGGGYAMLPILQREIVDKHKWATNDEIVDYYAIGQCTPGIIAVNTATFIGQKQLSNLGGIFATLGLVAPSIVIIELISAFISNFTSIVAVQYAFNGIRVCVAVLILRTVFKLFDSTVKNTLGAITFFVAFLFSVFLHLSPALLIIIAGAVGVIAGIIDEKHTSKKERAKK